MNSCLELMGIVLEIVEPVLMPLAIILVAWLGYSLFTKQQRWLMKRDSFLETIDIVDRSIQSIEDLRDPAQPKITYTPPQGKPTAAEKNKVCAKLMLSADNSKIVKKYLEIMLPDENSTGEDFLPVKLRDELLDLMRTELGNKGLLKDNKLIKFFVK